MALRKESFNDKDEQAANKTKRSRITIDVSPELRRRIKLAALKKDLSVSEYVGSILDETVPHDTSMVQQRGRPITRESIERLRRIRKQILADHNGQLFEDSAELIRQMREERTRELEQL
mgnify:CR=1 FL=1